MFTPRKLKASYRAIRALAKQGVIGQNSLRWGESPLAVIVKTDPTLTADEILAFCQDKLARFKQPKAVEFTDIIPRNPSGKILKRVLREQYPTEASE